MGKQKQKKREEPADTGIVELDLRRVLALEPEDRAVWLSKAMKLANEGDLKPTKVYDVVADRRVVDDVPEKIGRRMLNTLKKYMHVFSEKQQRYLDQSPLHLLFDLKHSAKREREEKEEAPARKSAKKIDPDAAQKMEEMMARCRDFVREKASGFDDRMKDAQEQEEVEKVAQAQRQLKFEWEQIATWHDQFLEFEATSMAGEDLRAQERARELEVARTLAEDARRRREAEEEEERNTRDEERRLSREERRRLEHLEDERRAEEEQRRWERAEAERQGEKRRDSRGDEESASWRLAPRSAEAPWSESGRRSLDPRTPQQGAGGRYAAIPPPPPAQMAPPHMAPPHMAPHMVPPHMTPLPMAPPQMAMPQMRPPQSQAYDPFAEPLRQEEERRHLRQESQRGHDVLRPEVASCLPTDRSRELPKAVGTTSTGGTTLSALLRGGL